MADDKKKPDANFDALEALQNQNRVEEPPAKPAVEDPRSATGFVATLARGGVPSDAISPTGPTSQADTKVMRNNTPPPRPQPMPRPAPKKTSASDIPEAIVVEVRKNEIPRPAIPAPIRRAAPEPAPRRTSSGAQDWYKLAVPLMLVMGTMLIFLGLWAVASLAGWQNPLIPHDHYGRRYHAAISLAWGMLTALPIGLALDALAAFMIYRLRVQKR